MPTEIIRILQEEADATYRDFSAKLLPPETLVLGVRIPALRRLAKQMLLTVPQSNIYPFRRRYCSIMKKNYCMPCCWQE